MCIHVTQLIISEYYQCAFINSSHNSSKTWVSFLPVYSTVSPTIVHSLSVPCVGLPYIYIAFSQMERFMGSAWNPPGNDRTQVGPMLAPWTLLSGLLLVYCDISNSSTLSGALSYYKYANSKARSWHKNGKTYLDLNIYQLSYYLKR